MKKRGRFILAGLAVAAFLLFAPQLVLAVLYEGDIYGQVEIVPTREYAVVFGAYVHPDHTLSDAAMERMEAAVQLYHQGRVQKLFVSGTNRSNNQAEAMARYAQDRGVAEEDIIVDGMGIDTHDTCRHFAGIAEAGVLISQGYHLPRAMYMCEREGVEVVGLAVNRTGILPKRGESRLAVYSTRIGRVAREAVLTWLFVLGIYDDISNEAELEEQGLAPDPRPHLTGLSWSVVKVAGPATEVSTGGSSPQPPGG
jgi:vancomycin permeability regulator SanA